MPRAIVGGLDVEYAVRELLPRPELWPVMPPEHTTELVVARIVEFGRAHPIR